MPQVRIEWLARQNRVSAFLFSYFKLKLKLRRYIPTRWGWGWDEPADTPFYIEKTVHTHTPNGHAQG